MFDATLSRPTSPRSLRERVRAAVDTAIEFATLGEVTLSRPEDLRPDRPAPAFAHPHRRPLNRRAQRRRPGTVRPRPQACLTPTSSPPAGSA